MKKNIVLLIIIFCFQFAFSQNNYKKCITTEIIKRELNENLEYNTLRMAFNDFNKLNNFTKHKNTIIIPVVIHVVHRIQDNIGSNTNISDAQIQDQLRILNEDFSKTNPEYPNPPRNTFTNYWGNPDIRFCLANVDPNGNPTSGITRTPTSQSSWNADDPDEQNYMKLTSQGGIDSWDPLRYMNIWVCNLTNSGGGQTLGYAYLPGLQGSFTQSWKDGIVIDYAHFGTIGNVSWSADGRTATHEVGHYLGLMHTFCEQGGVCCDNDLNSQYNWGDVDDTPATDDIYFGSVNAGTNNNTCNDLLYSNTFNTNVIDMDENFMSYSSDQWMFSQGQVNVMINTLNAAPSQGGRRDLLNSNVTVSCSGIQSWECDSQGNCIDPGDGSGTFSSYNACIAVCGCSGNTPQISEGFQAFSLPANWSIDNPDSDQTWEINTNYGYNSSSSICIENSIYAANGQIDDLNLPILDFSNASNINLSFDYAYSLWTNPSLSQIWSDTLSILISTDCGLNFQKIWEKAGLDLVTTNPVFNAFEWFPSSNNDWDSENINLNSFSNSDGVVIKFRNVNQYENNLFLDNINISANITTEIENEVSTDLVIYPNPTNNFVILNITGNKKIFNVLGKKMLSSYDNKIDVSSLENGIYILMINNRTFRFIKQ